MHLKWFRISLEIFKGRILSGTFQILVFFSDFILVSGKSGISRKILCGIMVEFSGKIQFPVSKSRPESKKHENESLLGKSLFMIFILRWRKITHCIHFYHIVQKLGTPGGTSSGLEAKKFKMLFLSTKSDKIDLVSVGLPYRPSLSKNNV